MNAFAAVMTGKTVGAIATVCLAGNGSDKILASVFKSSRKNNTQFETGKILLGNIVDGEKVVDQVVIGCEQENCFAINCHGNPLIIEMIMELLARFGAEPVTLEQFLERSNFISRTSNKIAFEAKLEQLKVRTIDGYKILQNQVEKGLSATIKSWINKSSLAQIKNEANEILKASKAAGHIIRGCKIVIAGPANSGKSTLLNCLAGREKSIVADIPGTTRDWVSTTVINGSIAMEIFDTAGLDPSLIGESAIDKVAQDRSIELLNKTDVVVWVIDGSQEISNLKSPISKIPVIIAINKSDLGSKIATSSEQAITISAKNGTGIDSLMKKIRTVLDVEGFDLEQAVCFNQRQQTLLEKLLDTQNITDAHSIITELLNGPVCV